MNGSFGKEKIKEIMKVKKMTNVRFVINHYHNWQILSSKYVFSNKELQNNTVKTAGLGDRIQAKHTKKKPS